jgi:hypothetical protein
LKETVRGAFLSFFFFGFVFPAEINHRPNSQGILEENNKKNREEIHSSRVGSNKQQQQKKI